MKRMNVDRARGLRPGMTDAEQAPWYRLRNRHLDGCKFRRQRNRPLRRRFRLHGADAGRGARCSQHLERQDCDQARTRYLQAKGYRVLRFWDNDALTNIESVLEVLMEAFGEPRPLTPVFSPEGEGAKGAARSTGVNE